MCWGGRGEPPCASPTGRYFSLDCELDQRLRQEEPDPTADPDLDEPRSRSDYDDDEASNEILPTGGLLGRGAGVLGVADNRAAERVAPVEANVVESV